MEFFHTTQLSIPLLQIMLLLTLSTIAVLFGRIKLALLLNYAFALYWGYVSNGELFDSLEKLDLFTCLYFGFGLAVIFLASVGFVIHHR